MIDGFAANVTPDEARALANDPKVAGIYPDTPFTAAAQTLPTGVDRIDADTNPSADIDGVDDVRIYSDVAVLDSGIASNTTDLKLMGGTDCTTDGLGYNDDRNGHGTHVAGIIGALDKGRAGGDADHPATVVERADDAGDVRAVAVAVVVVARPSVVQSVPPISLRSVVFEAMPLSSTATSV